MQNEILFRVGRSRGTSFRGLLIVDIWCRRVERVKNIEKSVHVFYECPFILLILFRFYSTKGPSIEFF